MRMLDVSSALSADTLVYPGDPRVSVKSALKKGCLTSRVTMGLHAGTHVDAPSHYIRGGKTVYELGLERLNGPARVCDFTGVWWEIASEDLMGERIRKGEIVILKTRNSKLMQEGRFSKEFTSLGPEGAEYLVRKGVKAVGIDYISIEKLGCDAVHRSLLSRDIPVIESLDLSFARAGRYRLMCLPLKFVGTEAAPARCILVSGR